MFTFGMFKNPFKKLAVTDDSTRDCLEMPDAYCYCCQQHAKIYYLGASKPKTYGENSFLVFCTRCGVSEVVTVVAGTKASIYIGEAQAKRIVTGNHKADKMFADLGHEDAIDGQFSSYQRVDGNIAYHIVENPVAEFYFGIAIDTDSGKVARICDFDLSLSEDWHYPSSEAFFGNHDGCEEDVSEIIF